jgi:hypothetical protein
MYNVGFEKLQHRESWDFQTQCLHGRLLPATDRERENPERLRLLVGAWEAGKGPEFGCLSISSDNSYIDRVNLENIAPCLVPDFSRNENTKCWQGCDETGTLILFMGIKLVQPLWKAVWGFLIKIKIELPYDPYS